MRRSIDMPVLENEELQQISAENPQSENNEKIEDFSNDEFETIIRETAKAMGGQVLFQMKLDEEEKSHWVAAVMVASDDARKISIIDLPCDGGEASIKPAEESTLPIATIASAYAGLVDQWKRAA
ncbi:hypothetical protein [Aquamicrobium sp. LC103]|uniref:hypothetical protein n=1 Tax=Aquamicrobium sp. LC103 TaxID=1120658 RepID=UPI00069AF02C|nr:hypothetical protein [Aquamicrobium sp. LC103]TKT81173.1 hypothetical protein XW59_004680 [Aquamicrobium sp. LC103]